MSVMEKMDGLMNAVRSVTGVSELLNMAMATDTLNNAKGGLLPTRTVTIGKDDDLDNFTEQGQFLIKNSTGTDNLDTQHDLCTSNGWGSLFVFENPVYVNQVMIDNNQNPAFIYHRSKNMLDNSPWTAWFKLGGVINPVLSVFKRMPSRLEVAA